MASCLNVIFRCYPSGATVLIDDWIFGVVDKGAGVPMCLGLGDHRIQWAKVGYDTGQWYPYTITQQMINMGGTHTDEYTMSPLKCTKNNCPYPNTCYEDVCGGSPNCTAINCPYPGVCDPDGYACTSTCDPFIYSYGRVRISPAGSTVTVMDGLGQYDTYVVPSTTDGLHLCLDTTRPYAYKFTYEHSGYETQEEDVQPGSPNTSFGDRVIKLLPTGTTCIPACTNPTPVCKDGTCVASTTICDGFNRKGVFDVNCLLENPMYLLAGAAVIVLLMSSR